MKKDYKKDYIYISTIVIIVLIVLLLLVCFKKNEEYQVTNEVTISDAIVYLKPGTEYNLNYFDNSTGTRNYVFESSNPNIATVDSQTGKIEAVSTGKVTIRAVDATTNTVYDYVDVVVEGPQKVQKTETKTTTTTTTTSTSSQVTIYLNKSELTIEEGKTDKLYATVSSSGAADRTVTWTSDNESVATVSNGVVTAKNAGTAIITATTSSGNKATCYVTVKERNIVLSSIKINANSRAVYVGSTLELSLIVYPSNAKYNSVTWTSSDNSLATVSSDGVVTGLSAGTVTITATSDSGKESTLKISVLDAGNEVSLIKINTGGTTLKVGDSLTLIATVFPSYAKDKSVTWSTSDSSVATVSSTGTVIAKKVGTAIITARSGNGKESTCKITVVEKTIEVTSIKMSQARAEVYVGEKVLLDAIITPNNASNKKVTWSSSDSSMARVSNGSVTTLKPGTVTITATSSNGKTATCTIVIKAREVAVTKITLSKSSTTIYVGQTEKITATISPSDATNKTITWSSKDSNIASVSSDGTIKGINPGTTEVIAKSNNGKTATIKVKVEAIVTGISLNKTSMSLEKGQKEKLIATITPSNAIDKTVTWSSSDSSIATVSSNGVVKAKNNGTVVITAKSSNGKVATCTVVVYTSTISVTGISLNQSSMSLKKGETGTLVATITPSDAHDKTVIWSSSDSSIATVSNGVVTAKKVGTIIITARTNNGKEARCTVVVYSSYIAVTGIELNISKTSINVGETAQLIATITPSNATNQSVTWSSSDSSIATVSKYGVVTGVKAGKVTITATSSNGKVAKSTITVKSNNHYLELNKTSVSCEIGDSVTIVTTTSSKIKNYNVENSKIVEVKEVESYKYSVKCLAKGKTTVKFVNKDGISATLTINVKKKTTSYNIASDTTFEKYQQIASCYSDTMAYRIIKIDGNYYVLAWMDNPNRQINNGLASSNAQGVASAETIFNRRATTGKCFVGVNGSFFSNGSPQSNVVLSEGRVAKNKGLSAAIIGINGKGNMTFYRSQSAQELVNDGVRNTWKISSHITADNSTTLANRTQIFQYDSHNYILYVGYGTVKSGLNNVQRLFPSITQGFNLDGGGSTKLYFRTKVSSLIKMVGGGRQIPDTLYISE